ncbi:MAG: DUF2807 domain-containing protein [Bacteroidota bacterium]
MRWILIAAAIFFIFVFAMVWLGVIAGLAFSMPILTNFFPSQELMTVVGMINVLFVVGLPLLAIILGIIRVVFGRRMGRSWVIAMIVFWFVNVFSLASIGGTLSQEFMVQEQIEEQLTTADFVADEVSLSYYQMADQNDRSFYIGGEHVELPGAPVRYNIKKSPDGEWHANKLVSARGRRGADARALARELHLPLQANAGSLSVPTEVPFSEISKWRNQEVTIEILAPEGAILELNERVIDRGRIRVDQYPEGTQKYRMSTSGQLICQACPTQEAEAQEVAPAQEQGMQFKDFNSILLSGPMKVTIEQGDTYDLQMSGPGQYLEQLESSQEEGRLTINLPVRDLSAPVRLYITLPDLQELELDQTDDVRVKDFSGEQLSIIASGDFELKAMVEVAELNLAAQDGVEIEFTGKTERLNAQLESESRLDTDRGVVTQANISAADGSRVKMKQGVDLVEQEISENSSLRIVN